MLANNKRHNHNNNNCRIHSLSAARACLFTVRICVWMCNYVVLSGHVEPMHLWRLSVLFFSLQMAIITCVFNRFVLMDGFDNKYHNNDWADNLWLLVNNNNNSKYTVPVVCVIPKWKERTKISHWRAVHNLIGHLRFINAFSALTRAKWKTANCKSMLTHCEASLWMFDGLIKTSRAFNASANCITTLAGCNTFVLRSHSARFQADDRVSPSQKCSC